MVIELSNLGIITASNEWYIPRVPTSGPNREFKVGDKIRVNLHHGKM